MDNIFKIEDLELFKQVLGDILDNLYNLDDVVSNVIIVDASNIKAAKIEIKNIILDTHLNINKVTKLLSLKINDEDRLRIFISLLEKKKSELLNLTVLHYSCAFGETLNTFDWKLKLVCGTSELKTLSHPILQLAFYTITSNHKSALRLHELNKDMLLKLIETLEDCVGDNTINEIK